MKTPNLWVKVVQIDLIMMYDCVCGKGSFLGTNLIDI